MIEFHSNRSIKSTRKPHCCEGCEQPIDVGSSAKYYAGKFEGDFYDCYFHIDCRQAQVEWNDLAGFDWDEHCHLWHLYENRDDPAFFCDENVDFGPTLAGKYPQVLLRLEEREAARNEKIAQK